MVVMAAPEHIVCEEGVDMAFGVGLTVTVAVIEAPAHPAASNGVMMNVTTTGAPVVLVKVPVILPVPLAAIPVTETVLSRVQVKLVAVPVNVIEVIAVPQAMV